MGKQFSCPKRSLNRSHETAQKTADGLALRRISSRQPIIYSTWLEPVKNYKTLLIKRKHYRRLDITYPDLLIQLKGKRKFNKLFEKTKNPQSIHLHQLLTIEPNGRHSRLPTILSFIRSIKRVKSLSIEFDCHSPVPGNPNSQKSQKYMASILPYVRCRAISFSFYLRISPNYNKDGDMPMLVGRLVNCIKPMHNLKSLHINLEYVKQRTFLLNNLRNSENVSLPRSSKEQELIERLRVRYQRLRSIEDFRLRFDCDIHPIFRCFSPKLKALPRLQRVELASLDLVTFADFVKVTEENQCMAFATFCPLSLEAFILTQDHSSC